MLFVRLSPVLGESWASYLRYCATKNSYESIQHMAQGLAMKAGDLMRLDPRMIGEKYGLPFHGVEHELAALVMGVRKPPRVARSSSTRVCPACLREGLRRLPSIWEQSMSIVCDLHQVALLDRCPSCRSEIATFRPQSNLCACGADFGDVSPRPAPAWIQTLHIVFETAKREDRILTFAGERRIEAEGWRRLEGFHSLMGGAGVADGSLTIDHVLEFGPLFEGWPDGFTARVSQYIDNEWCTRWMLYTKLGGRKFGSIDAAFKAALPPRSQRKPTVVRAAAPRVSNEDVKHAAAKLGVSPWSLIRLLNVQEPAPATPFSLGNELRPTERRQAIDSFAAITGTVIDSTEAAERLGCLKSIARRLCREGLIRVRGVKVLSNRISSAATDALLANMRARAHKNVTCAHVRVCFSHLLTKRVPITRTLRIADLVASIESGELLLYVRRGSDGSRLDDMYCKLADIKAWRRKYRIAFGAQAS